MASASKEKQWIRAEASHEIKILFEEAAAALISDYMYMYSFEEEGLTFDAFKHQGTRKYIFIPKRNDGLRLTAECTD